VSDRDTLADRAEAIAWALVLAGLMLGGLAVLIGLRACGWRGP